jgi:hypothetical protein
MIAIMKTQAKKYIIKGTLLAKWTSFVIAMATLDKPIRDSVII